MAENILIEFTASTEGLEPAVDQLERIGAIDKQAAAAFKATNAELQKRQSTLANTAKVAQQAGATTKKSIDDVDKSVKTLVQDFVDGFQEGVTAELKAAGVSAEEFANALKSGQTEVSKSSETLKSRLGDIKKQMELLKAEGKDNTDQYRALTAEAGNLRDAIGDVNTEIQNASANSQALDGLIGVAQGVTGAFAVGQGAIALFGNESEELQETLLRVNATMAILQGFQQVQTVLQKESAAVRLITNAQLAIENGLNSTSIVVRTGAAVAQKALNAAMAANPIGILVVAVAGLITVLATFGRSAAEARRQTSALNVALSSGAENFREREDAIRKSGEGIVNALENEGAVGSKIAQQEIENQKLLIQSRKERQAELEKLLADSPDADLEKRQELSKEIRRLQDQEINDRIDGNNLVAKLGIEQRREELQGIADLAAARLATTVKNSKAELDAAKASARAKAAVDINSAGQNAAEVLRIQAELNDQIRDLDRQFAQVRLQDRIAGIEAALLTEQQLSRAISERQSQTEIDLQKRLIQQKANLELLQEGLTQNQILEIKKRAQTEIATLQKNFNKQISEEALQDFISSNNAQLAAIDLTNKERLDLTLDNIIAQAEIEVQQNQGLSEKIKEINAKRDADIRAARLESIRQTVEEEIALRTATGGVDTRTDEKLLAAQDQLRAASSEREKRTIEERLAVRRLSLNEELNLIDQLADRELSNIGLRVDALNESFAEGLISYKDYNIQYEQLTDQQAQVTEDAEQRKRDAMAQTEKEAKERQRLIINSSIEFARTTLSLLEEIFQQQADREQARIDQQRERVTELRAAGAITEKEEQRRLRQLDQEERKLKVQQAKRNKAIAVFNAVISTAQAVATALTAGPIIGPILAAITAALGAAQIALIVSKPIPAFAKGKKNSYQGPGIVGEAGSELIEKNGQLFVAPKKTIVWLGSKDKVYNHQETVRMLEKPGLKTASVERIESSSLPGERIDYNKLGKTIAANIPQMGLNIDQDGFTQYVQGATSYTKYLNSRRGYK